MRFIITAQSSAENEATEQPSDFDVELFKERFSLAVA